MTAQREMPKYKCHKEVWALKIKEILLADDVDATHCLVIPEDDGYGVFDVNLDWYRKHKPQLGGYYVVYEDGYQSYSPAAAFESGYARM